MLKKEADVSGRALTCFERAPFLQLFFVCCCRQAYAAACICSFLSHPNAIANVTAVTLLFALPPLLYRVRVRLGSCPSRASRSAFHLTFKPANRFS
jgi:hypothetical protein